MVAFTRIPYSEALARSESQAKWMTAMGYIGLAGVAVAAAFGASSLIKVGPGCWGMHGRETCSSAGLLCAQHVLAAVSVPVPAGSPVQVSGLDSATVLVVDSV